jgi:hypothetical protein
MLRLRPLGAMPSAPWNWRCVDTSRHFPLKYPGDEDPFNGPNGQGRADQFSQCLGILFVLALGPLQWIYSTLLVSLILAAVLMAIVYKTCPSVLAKLMNLLPGGAAKADRGHAAPGEVAPLMGGDFHDESESMAM